MGENEFFQLAQVVRPCFHKEDEGYYQKNMWPVFLEKVSENC